MLRTTVLNEKPLHKNAGIVVIRHNDNNNNNNLLRTRGHITDTRAQKVVS